MSGGSFDYLCFKDIGEVLASGNLQPMANALMEYKGGEKAAADTLAFLAVLPPLDERLRPLRDVWRAVEWHHSADSGPDDVVEALKTYETRRVLSTQALDADRLADRVLEKLPGGPLQWSWLRSMLRGALISALDTR